MNKSILSGLIAISFMSAAGAASATTVKVTSGQMSAQPGATTATFDSGQCNVFQCSGNYAIQSQSKSGFYAQPAGDTTDFLTVPDDASNTPTSATLTLPNGEYNYFGLYWGSIDSYNSLSFYDDAGNQIYTINGSQALADTQGNSDDGYFNFFFGKQKFNQVKISSTQYAFESDNEAFANVPEPSSVAMFGLGLIGLGWMVRRRRKTFRG